MKALRFFLVVGLVAGVGCALPPSREAASGGAHHPSSAQEIEASSAPETCDRTRTIELRRTLADAVEEARILTCAAGTVRVTVSRRERVEPTEPASDRGDDVAEGGDERRGVPRALRAGRDERRLASLPRAAE
jgi:hypothetical protein